MYSKRVYQVVKSTNERRIGELCTYTVTVVLKTEHCILGIPVFSTNKVLSQEPTVRPCLLSKK